MPYIKAHARARINDGGVPLDAGELNYQLTELVQMFLHEEGENYAAFNTVLGVLTAMQHEIYRRLIAPYEDEKITENGDVFPRKETPND